VASQHHERARAVEKPRRIGVCRERGGPRAVQNPSDRPRFGGAGTTAQHRESQRHGGHHHKANGGECSENPDPAFSIVNAGITISPLASHWGLTASKSNAAVQNV